MKISLSNGLHHPGILFLDSPRDKDLDLTKYKKIIDLVSNDNKGQVFFTGSIEDKDLFPENVLIRMTEGEKLLKHRITEKKIT